MLATYIFDAHCRRCRRRWLPPLPPPAAGRARFRPHQLRPLLTDAAAVGRSCRHRRLLPPPTLSALPGVSIVSNPNHFLPLSAAPAPAARRACHYGRRRRQLQPLLTATAVVGRSCRHRWPLPLPAPAALPGGAIVVNPDLCPLSSAALVAAAAVDCNFR